MACPGALITIVAATPGTVIIDPPSGNGFYIGHNYHMLSGLIVTGATTNGIQVGPHDVGGGSVTGVFVDDCHVHGNAVTGVKFSKAVSGRVRHSVIHNNGSHGISYSGSGANIFNNLVYSNGCAGPGCGDYGISILGVTGFSNDGHKVTNNTIYGNLSGGLRLSDDQASSVFGVAINNIIMGSPVGIKEQGGGSFTLDHNDVFFNTEDNYQLVASGIGANSISVYPEFVDPVINDFRLKRVGAGQTVNSPCIDAGSATAEVRGLGGRTAFTDNSPDVGDRRPRLPRDRALTRVRWSSVRPTAPRSRHSRPSRPALGLVLVGGRPEVPLGLRGGPAADPSSADDLDSLDRGWPNGRTRSIATT